ncbi:hypothetical protein [uncultured Sulfitobacter sp.]|uniref:hypothetical protein n=1 Tax=uncultured Sulfitobacter sp. TaxID=191468 RepID=UPI00261909EC|nr:hypothetical protein [uncultured Sulfitobacter sp.]
MTLVSEMAVLVETRPATVHIAPMSAPHRKHTVGIIWRKSSAPSEKLEASAEFVRIAAAAHPAFAKR